MAKKHLVHPDPVPSDECKCQPDIYIQLSNDMASFQMLLVLIREKDVVDRVLGHQPVHDSIIKWFIPGKKVNWPQGNPLVDAQLATFTTDDGKKWRGRLVGSTSSCHSTSRLLCILPVVDGESTDPDAVLNVAVALLNEREAGQQMQQCIENNNSFTFAIMNSLRFGVIAADMDGQILYANDTACIMVNIRRRDLLTIPVSGLVPNWNPIFESVCQGQKFQNEEVAIVSTDGNVYKFNINVSPINDLTGHLLGMVISLREIENLYEIVNKYTGMQARFTFDDIIAKSKEMRHLVEYARTIADSPSTVLIEGESGTGKEVFAQSIHNASSRREAGFVAINCAAIPDNLIESELFGYDDGAFTGAKKGGHPGKFELAHKGTLFLDEIGEMKADTQAKLLRAIQEGAVMRIGGSKVVPVDVRIIAATNKNLKKEIENGTFRLDLFYRLSVIPLKIPPLRNRKSDLPSLIRMLLQKKSLRLKKNIPQLHYSEFQQLLEYQWPGNIRELENFIEQLVNLDGKFSFDYFKQQMSGHAHTQVIADDEDVVVDTHRFIPCSLDEMEKDHIRTMIEHCSGNMSQVARLLGISRNTLYLKMKKFDLPR